MNAVKLTKKQSDALEVAKKLPAYEKKAEIVQAHMDRNCWAGPCSALRDLDLDTLIQALYIGYRVEQTPHEKVRETFEYTLERIGDLGDHPQVEHWKGMKTGIITTLASLNIKIDGVNT